MARGRSRSGSVASITNGHQARAPTSSPQLKRQFAAAIDSIYHNNLTVLQRKDPTIVSILDSFSHVCLYHFNGSKWEKQGYEGSMFLVEHEDSPTYGLFILNRMGTGDWGRRIYPEDDMQSLGDYLMYRYFPEYTRRRTELQLPHPIPADFRSMFELEFAHDPNSVGQLQADGSESGPKEKKGASVTLGLWMFPTDAREPLKDVVIRLHSYVKRGLRYPDEYRYGPGRPAPQNPHLRQASMSSDSNAEDTPRMNRAPQTIETSGSSEVDKLFAKLQTPIPANTNTTSQSMSAQHWFAALTGQNVEPVEPSAPSPAPSAPTSTRGLALLDSIFASVQPPVNHSTQSSVSTIPPTQNHLPPHPEEIMIVSPKPQSSTLPQILNQDVISTLLGLGSDSGSRASSVAPSATSSRRSGLNIYEGDNEFSEDNMSEASYSTTSTVADSDPAILAVGLSGVPMLSFNNGGSDSEGEYTSGSSLRVQGDVTPRVPARGIDPNSPPPLERVLSQQFLIPVNGISRKGHAAGPAMKSTLSIASTSSAVTVKAAANQRSQRLVPFEADSELWPYPRAPVDERATDLDGNDVVELDFSDTRALSDPATFSNRLQKQKKQKREGKRKTREERAAERERERDAIEKSWDDPTNGLAHAVDMVSQPGAPALALHTVNGNGKRHETTAAGEASSSKAANGDKSEQLTNGVLNGQSARDALLAALLPHPQAPIPTLPRKQFVQEVLSLIYSDNAFVDKLYEEYTSRAH
ncbi:unnamed protein product [Somion occarium]|uniref:mRNA-decapping enzyme 1B n=1 Tax=Somion occarium TaxID=3059160 RepID=A0ABP1DN40_9APHY